MKKILYLLFFYTTFQVAAFAATGEDVDKEISGTVRDEKGDPLPGVNIVVTGTSTGTTTDVDGKYKLRINDDAKSITFSFIGYKTVTLNIGNNLAIDLAMEMEVGSLNEVVVTGYGQTQNEHLVSTAVSMIQPETMIKDRPISRLEQAIQGATPAVVVMKESGSPGAPLTVRMRGVGTAGDAAPLTLLDGFQVPDMNFVNPNDIAGIGVYKDAAASAIYGARGGNGVLNLQSKTGDTNKLLNVNFSAYYGVQSLASEGDYLNTRQYAQYYNASYTYMIRQGLPVTGAGRPPFTEEEISKLPNTSWIKAVSQDAPIQDYHLALSGGKGKTSYYLSGGLFDQEGIIGSTDFGRKTLNLKVNTGIKDIVTVSVLGIYANNQRNFVAENSENSRLLSSVASLPAVYPVFAESGSPFNNGLQGLISYNGVVLNSIAEFGNPILNLRHNENRSDADIFFGNALVGVKITDGLKFNTSFGALTVSNYIKQFGQYFSYPDQQFESNPPTNSLSETNVDQSFWQWEGYFSYDKKIAGHSFSAIVGTSLLQNELDINGRFGRDFTENEFDNVSFNNITDPTSIVETQPRSQINTTASYYGRINYNYKEKYLFGATLRIDGSSKFGSDNKYGTFPSLNAGWLLSQEEFMKGIDFVNQFKLRASWGINGNDRIPPYQYFDRYVIDGADNLIKQDYNPEIKWEEITQTDIGLDVDMFNNKLGVTLDYYVKETKDMLIDFPNPAYTGLPAPVRNAATVQNTGFETIILYRGEIGAKFKFELNANVGFNKNEITNLGGGLPLYGAATRVFSGAPYLTKSDIGDPIASFFGYKFDGLDDAGNPVYKDISGPDGVPDGLISPAYDRTIIGNPYPKMVYGFNLTLRYAGFDFTTFLTGVQGNDVVNASTGYGFQYSNRTTRVLDAWSLENPTSTVMRPSALEVVNHEFSDYYIEDGSYMRFKNFTLGYTFPESLLKKIKLDNLRVYVSANNLFTFTNYSGYDPEIGANNDPRDVGVDRGFYPQAKSILGGLQLSF